MEFNPEEQLEGMRQSLSQYYKEIARWDKPVSGFSEEQKLALGNLCVSLEQTVEYFNTAIEKLRS